MKFEISSVLYDDGRGRLLTDVYPKLKKLRVVNIAGRYGGKGLINLETLDDLMAVISATGKALIVGKDEDGPYIQIYDDFVE